MVYCDKSLIDCSAVRLKIRRRKN